MYKIIGLEEPVCCISKKDVERNIRMIRDDHVAIQWASLSGIRNVRWISVDRHGDAYHTYSEQKPFDVYAELPEPDSIMASW